MSILKGVYGIDSLRNIEEYKNGSTEVLDNDTKELNGDLGADEKVVSFGRNGEYNSNLVDDEECEDDGESEQEDSLIDDGEEYKLGCLEEKEEDFKEDYQDESQSKEEEIELGESNESLESSKSSKEESESNRVNYSELPEELLWSYVKQYMIEQGVKQAPVDADLVESKFGSMNILKLVKKRYLVPKKSGYTMVRE